jgi:hypothetical protein
MEAEIIFIILFFKRKMTSIYLRMEDDLNKYYMHITAHTSRQPDQQNKLNKMAQIKRKSTSIGCDIIVN